MATDGSSPSTVEDIAENVPFGGGKEVEDESDLLKKEEVKDEVEGSGNDITKDSALNNKPTINRDGDEISWDGPDDPENPKNWPVWKKWAATLVTGLAILVVNFGSSVMSPGVQQVAIDLHVSLEVSILSVTVYVFGFALGPLFAAPLSEEFGRNFVYLPFAAVFIVLQIGAALAPNIGCLLALRFLTGLVGSPPPTIAAGTITDVWRPGMEQMKAIAAFLLFPFVGPVLGPIVGGYVNQFANWRWSLWVLMIFAGASFPTILWLPETHGPTILLRKARRLRRKGVQVVDPPHKPLSEIFKVALLRPTKMMYQEPIVYLLSLYVAFTFGILFFFFLSIPYVFGGVYDFSLGSRGLVFIAIGLGTIAGNRLFIPIVVKIAMKLSAFNKIINGTPMDSFLLPGMIGGLLLPVALFWFGWSSRESVHWIAPVIAGFPFGLSMMLIFLSASMYMASTYQQYAASAFAVNSFARYGFAGVFPLFAKQLLDKLGIGWGISVFGFFAVLMMPLPFIFYWFGEKIRAASPTLTPKVKQVDV